MVKTYTLFLFSLAGLAALDICRQARHIFDVTQQEDVRPAERTALADVFAELDLNEKYWGTENNAYDNDYNPIDSPCNLNYINCVDGKVQNITLTSMALSGSISVSIDTLTYLEVLNLRDNQLVGIIPPEIEDLCELCELILAHNRIQGEIPNNMSNITKLKVFQVHANRLTGTIPNEIQVNAVRYNESSFTSDCGYPSFFPDPLVCKNCLMCCNSMEECTKNDDNLNFKYYLIGAFVFFLFLIACLSKFGSFLKLNNNDQVIFDDVFEKNWN